jgi:soluble lytic murein transglycosylase-like protein
MRLMVRLGLFLAILPLALSCEAKCFEQAGARYRISPTLLRAISAVESGGNTQARHLNLDGSEDIGHMQINSFWLPMLAGFGISRERLLDPCTNTYVGAWILARNFRQLGYGWDAVGAYNARTAVKRKAYARRVAAQLSTWQF